MNKLYIRFLKDGTIIAHIVGLEIARGFGREVAVEYMFNGKRKAINELISEIELILLCEIDYKVCRQL